MIGSCIVQTRGYSYRNDTATVFPTRFEASGVGYCKQHRRQQTERQPAGELPLGEDSPHVQYVSKGGYSTANLIGNEIISRQSKSETCFSCICSLPLPPSRPIDPQGAAQPACLRCCFVMAIKSAAVLILLQYCLNQANERCLVRALDLVHLVTAHVELERGHRSHAPVLGQLRQLASVHSEK